MQIAHVVLCVLVLVGVRRVTVDVHIGLDEVVVVRHFCVAILFVNCCIRRYSLYTDENNAMGFPPKLSGLQMNET